MMFTNNLLMKLAMSASILMLLQISPAKSGSLQLSANTVDLNVDFAEFLSDHDMIWDQLPQRWETAPFLGNGSIGFMLYQDPSQKPNHLRVDFGRGDYYDHRPVSRDRRDSWVNVGRLPVGHFEIASSGDITDIHLRLNLWNASLSGRITTRRGSYTIDALVDSNSDVLVLQLSSSPEEDIHISWHPEVPYSSARIIAQSKLAQAQQNGTKHRSLFKHMANLDYPDAPKVMLGKKQEINYAYQELLNKQGEATVAWTVKKTKSATRLLASLHHSYPESNSREIAINNIKNAQSNMADASLISQHQQWWHDYYKKSFISLNDKRVEGFYWIQMYKFASATRGTSSILDLMGPWYQKTIWPLIWADLNVQLTYWTTLTANRLGVAASLPNNIDKYKENLHKNVAQDWQADSTNIGTIFPPNMLSPAGKQVPDILLWVLHNYWLYCQYAGDTARLRDKFFPLLKTTVNTYLHYLNENVVALDDGKIHIKKSWSPEYPQGHGMDINFSLSLLRWASQTLLELDEIHELNDAKSKEWQNIIDNLADFQVDENGLRIGRDIPFSKSHRHYSHLLGLYPLYLFDPFNSEDKTLLKKSVDHWLAVAHDPKKKVDDAMPVTGYTATGAASMYASLHEPAKAYRYLYSLLNHERISSTTMYSEGSPVIESPLSFASSVHDMVLQSWGGKIQVFPAVPKQWPDLAFYHLRTQGAFLVSATKQAGVTQFIEVESLVGSELIIKSDIVKPQYLLNGKSIQVVELPDGFVKIDLKKGEKIQLLNVDTKPHELTINAVENVQALPNIYGLNANSRILPGYRYYLQ